MPRSGRIVLPQHPHHVTQRGVRSMRIFTSDEDRKEYLSLLSQRGKVFKLEFLAYCLMPNHVHLIVIPEDVEGLARGIGEANRLYTRRINFREKARGHFFQGRFFSAPLDERHFIAAMRYIARNPVRAGMVKQAWEYPWSSAAFFAGSKINDPLVCERNPFGLGLNWIELFDHDPDEIEALRRNVRLGRPCGNVEFQKKVKRFLNQHS
jgi:putative transposase